MHLNLQISEEVILLFPHVRLGILRGSISAPGAN